MNTTPARQPPGHGGAFHVAHTLTGSDAATLTLGVAEQQVMPAGRLLVVITAPLPGHNISRPGLGVDGDQRCDGRGAAQLVQAAGTVRPDAADRDAQPGAD